VTETTPVAADAGTLAVIDESDRTAKLAVTPLKVTDLAVPRPVPVMVTAVPTAPDCGLKPAIEGPLAGQPE
jgi:hypothetical protein